MLHVTLKDVAERAGVTPTVVSHVLRNHVSSVRVSAATAERVRQAAKDLDYRVNVVARNLRERRTFMIGVLHGVGFSRPAFDGDSRYWAALFDGIVDGAFVHGYSVTLCPKLLGANPEDAMSDGRFDGLVWYSSDLTEENRRMVEGCGTPMVIIHTPAAEFSNRFSSVICDNDQGVSLAIDHLVTLGHRKIGFVANLDFAFNEQRIRQEAFVAQMTALGLSADIIDARNGHVGLEAYFSQGIRHTGFFAVNEAMAAQVVIHARAFGYRVPRDFSIVGFDSTSFCNSFDPPLTAVSQPLNEMGRRAVDLLVKEIQSESSSPSALVVPCGLDVRGSTTHFIE